MGYIHPDKVKVHKSKAGNIMLKIHLDDSSGKRIEMYIGINERMVRLLMNFYGIDGAEKVSNLKDLFMKDMNELSDEDDKIIRFVKESNGTWDYVNR